VESGPPNRRQHGQEITRRSNLGREQIVQEGRAGMSPKLAGDISLRRPITVGKTKQVLAEASPTVIAVHGEESAEDVVFLAGLDEERQKKFRDLLIASGFTVKQSC
jgi:Poly-gamma-glutamate hydrolase